MSSPAAIDVLGLPKPSLGSLLRLNGPRFANDAFGPVLAFYIGWRLHSVATGVGAATVVAAVSFARARRQTRSGALVTVSLAFVLIQAVVGLISNSATVYLSQGVLLSGIYGLVFAGSVAIGRPLAGVFAAETYPFPAQVRESSTFRRIFSVISLAWGVYLVCRSALRIFVLLSGGVGLFVVVNTLTSFPLTTALIVWSFWYAPRAFSRSAEWGWAFSAPPESA